MNQFLTSNNKPLPRSIHTHEKFRNDFSTIYQNDEPIFVQIKRELIRQILVVESLNFLMSLLQIIINLNTVNAITNYKQFRIFAAHFIVVLTPFCVNCRSLHMLLFSLVCANWIGALTNQNEWNQLPPVIQAHRRLRAHHLRVSVALP